MDGFYGGSKLWDGFRAITLCLHSSKISSLEWNGLIEYSSEK